jgi:hypothetical protein
MEVTRRKFLKYLAVGITAPSSVVACVEAAAENTQAAIAPEPLIPFQSMSYEWITYEEAQAIYPSMQRIKPIDIDGERHFVLVANPDAIQQLFDINPILSGELGIHNGVTIHKHKDRDWFRDWFSR